VTADAATHLFRRPVTFVTGAATVDGIPATRLPEVALIGRSNVGKSSLINALVGRGDVARVSNTPGRTQQLNFFDLGGRLMLVDMPGYGYAEAPRDKKAEWSDLIRFYLKGRPPLRRALVLVDARHGFKDSDQAIMELMDDSAVNYQIVLTKCDKLKPKELEQRLEEMATAAKLHVAAHPALVTTSAASGHGLDQLRTALSELALPE